MPVSMIYCIAWAMIPVYGGVYPEEGEKTIIQGISPGRYQMRTFCIGTKSSLSAYLQPGHVVMQFAQGSRYMNKSDTGREYEVVKILQCFSPPCSLVNSSLAEKASQSIARNSQGHIISALDETYMCLSNSSRCLRCSASFFLRARSLLNEGAKKSLANFSLLSCKRDGNR